MNLDPKIIAALVGVVAVVVSAVVSYFVSQKIDNRKNTIEYLKGKIAALEDKKKLLVGMEFQSLGEGVTKDNLIDRYHESLAKQFNSGAVNFRHIDHYLSPSLIADLDKRIKTINLALGTANIEGLAGRKVPDEWVGDIPRDDDLRKELTAIVEAIIQAVNDELRMSIENIERLSELNK